MALQSAVPHIAPRADHLLQFVAHARHWHSLPGSMSAGLCTCSSRSCGFSFHWLRIGVPHSMPCWAPDDSTCAMAWRRTLRRARRRRATPPASWICWCRWAFVALCSFRYKETCRRRSGRAAVERHGVATCVLTLLRHTAAARGAARCFNWMFAVDVLLSSSPQASGKMLLLHKLLPKLRAEGHKVLIFSQVNEARTSWAAAHSALLTAARCGVVSVRAQQHKVLAFSQVSTPVHDRHPSMCPPVPALHGAVSDLSVHLHSFCCSSRSC